MLQRPPVHFLQSPDQWGNLQQYIRSSRRQSSQSHHARYMRNLKRFLMYGTDEEQNIAKVLLEEVTKDDMLRASVAVGRCKKDDTIQAGSSRFTDNVVAALEASLVAIADRLQSDANEAARASTTRRIPRHTLLPTNNGKVVQEQEDSDDEANTVEEDESEEEYDEGDPLLPLQQELKWYVGKKNVLALFFEFKQEMIGSKYSLTKDSIAYLATIGEFAKSLDLRTFQAVMLTLPKLVKDAELSATLNLILPAPETTLEEATDNIRDMDHRKDWLFSLFGFNMAILETQVLGCARRMNADRVPLVEKVVIANFADAVVTHNGVQPVLVECGRPNGPDHDKRFSDHYKLARDLKDTWAHCTEGMIIGARVPPRNIKVFGIQRYGQQVELYCLDFTGCFRLMQLASFTVPRCGEKSFAEEFKRMVMVCHGFGKMVTDEVKRWDRAPYWEDEGHRQVAEKALGYLPNTTPKPSKSPKSKRRREDDDEE
ncbi:hypothetical protein BG003_008771 [Podila horticola]|nr:hypothetical protein BG003_008771 [Podila horticola]